MLDNALSTLINSGQQQTKLDPVGSFFQGRALAGQEQQQQIGNALSQQKLDLGQQQLNQRQQTFEADQQKEARAQEQQQYILSQVDELFNVEEGQNPEQDEYMKVLRLQASSGDVDGALSNMAKVLESRAGMKVEQIFVDDSGTATAIVNQGGKLQGLQMGLIGKSTQNKLNIQTVTDAAGNVRQIATDPTTGQVVNQNNLGGIGKPQSGLDIQFGPDGRPLSITQGSKGSGQPKAPTGFAFNEDGSRLAPIPGGPAEQVPAESAAKIALLGEAKNSFTQATQLLFEGGNVDTGAIDNTNVATSAVGVPFTEGRQVKQLLTQSIRAKLRAESGAVISDEEVEADYAQFFPSVFDTDGQKRSKIQRLGQFLDSAIDISTAGRGDPLNRGNALSAGPQIQPSGSAQAAAPPQSDVAQPQTQAEYDALPSGAIFIDDEGVKVKP